MYIIYVYIKDLLAFIFCSIFLLIIPVFNIKITTNMVCYFLLLIIVTDGIYTFYPDLHNTNINL